MHDKLTDEVKAVVRLSLEDIALLTDSLTEIHIKKGDHFLKEGQVCTKLGYISKGLMMYYRIIDGIEAPCDFAVEHNWVTYLKSFTGNSPSDMAIVALEDTSLLTLSGSRMNELVHVQPKFIALRNYYTELYFIRNTEYATSLATLTAKERYYRFMKENPALLNRVPQYLLAAYLGIKPQSLSRIRKSSPLFTNVNG